MNYLDRSYCRESIVDCVRRSPEGTAYSIVRRLFIEVVEESNAATHLLHATKAAAGTTCLAVLGSCAQRLLALAGLRKSSGSVSLKHSRVQQNPG